MTEQEAIEIIWERHMDCEDYRLQFDSYPDGYDFELDQAILIAAQALEAIQKYREMDKKLREAYGDCDGLLERSVDLLCEHAGIDISEPIKARLLTDEDVDKWDAYREIGTVEECREAVEKQKPKKIYHQKWNGIDGVPYDLCPTCENNLCTTGVFARNKMNYCEKCGQKLCWNENMEDE